MPSILGALSAWLLIPVCTSTCERRLTLRASAAAGALMAFSWISGETLVDFDVGPPDHLRPFLHVLPDQRAVLLARAGQGVDALCGKLALQLGQVEDADCLPVQSPDDGLRSAGRRAQA